MISQRAIRSSSGLQHGRVPVIRPGRLPLKPPASHPRPFPQQYISTTEPPGHPNTPGQVPVARSAPHLTWPHIGWDDRVLLDVVPSHRKPRTSGDRFAWRVTRVCRWVMDIVTGMKPEQRADSRHPTTAVVAQTPLTESQWLIRFIFLESIAGVPGMVAGTVRHLHSIRRFKLDQGWIKTLLEESYNERMHLLTFLEMHKPGWLMRMMVFGAQGIFYNAMFISYLISPKICHRFVGYLEEEAVHTYTRCLRELDNGSLPQWSSSQFKIPTFAIKYWSMREGRRSMRDLILSIRVDEASHRGVNHTLGNLDEDSDPNPFIETTEHASHMHVAATRSGDWCQLI